MSLSIKQRAQLRAKQIIVRIEYASGTVKCSTPSGERYYTASDLVQLAKPGFMDRLTAWMNQGVVS
ncbi:hypothetical protein [Vreelandella maris]|uniref:hypothetical protein n=1 Tax=Vreelandella maris TaxID=2729617 RepID=UPI0030EBA025